MLGRRSVWCTLGIALAVATFAGTAGISAAAPPTHRQLVAQVNLVADRPGHASLTDPDLVNSWGLAFSPTSPLWSANNGAGNSTLYAGAAGGAPVTKVPITVTIPGGAPTGVAFNDTTDFATTGPGGTAPARFIFSTENGDIAAWDPTATPGTAAVVAHVQGAVFKSLALLHTPFGPFLLAADFRHGRIDVFDGDFDRVPTFGLFFNDRRLPRGYAPFNIMVAGQDVYVTYAKQDRDRTDELHGIGLGLVDRYRAFGLIGQRIASHGLLDAPWGLAIAPPAFGPLAGDLLVGNFGNGRINAFDPRTGRFAGQVRGTDGRPLVIDGLWALLPGTATTGGTDGIWFSAGPDDEMHGLLGILRPAP